MKFEESGIAGKIVRFRDLEDTMKALEIIRGGQWDYERVTFDHKFENRTTGAIHYLRVQGVAIKGEIEDDDAEVKLMTPILGHYYYPHGIEYDEEMPEVVVQKSKEKLTQLKELLDDVEMEEISTHSDQDIIQRLLDIEAVQNVSEMETSGYGSGHPVISCHLLIDGEDADSVVKEATALLRDEFEFEKTTIQVDRATQKARN